MPITSRIDTRSDLAIHTANGPLSIADIVAAYESIASDPSFRPDMGVLWDMSNTNASGAGPADVKAVVRAIGNKLGDNTYHKVAIAASSDFLYGLARMYEIYASRLPIDVKVFRSREEARVWLCDELPVNDRTE